MSRSARLTAVSLAAVGSVLISGCSSSSKHPAAAVASSTGSTTAAAVTSQQLSSSGTASTPSVSTAPATGTSTAPAAGGGADLTAKGCTAIKVFDVQPLVSASVKVEFDPGSAALDPTHSFQCEVNNPTMIINVHPEDTSKQVYNEDVAAENVPAVPLPGVGDVAVWTGVSLVPGSCTSAPDVYAHKGSITCEVSPNGSGLTIPTDSGVAPSITQANETAFAAKLGVLCNDVFAAIA